MAQASIAHEFHKIRDKWATIEKQNWKLLIWVSDYQDIDIIDKFMQIEQSPIGLFKDIFFRFDTLFTDPENFETELWDEFLLWFKETDPKYDITAALKRDGFLPEEYQPDHSLPRTAEHLWLEFARLRKALAIHEENFIIYFPAGMHERGLATWFNKQMLHGLPENIRLVSLDIKEKRKLASVKTKGYNKVIELCLKLDMINAIKNELNKEGKEQPNNPESQFNKQIRKVIDTARKNDEPLLEQEIQKMFLLANKINNESITSTALFVAANSYFTIFKHQKSLKYVEEVLQKTKQDDKNNLEQTYPLWRSTIILKAALLLAMKDEAGALSVYQELADKALEMKDIYFIMEGHRLLASIYHNNKQYEKAWDHALLSIQAGSYLDLETRRHSTYLISAEIAYQIGLENKSKEEMQTLKECLVHCIGKDWRKLIKEYDFQES